VQFQPIIGGRNGSSLFASCSITYRNYDFRVRIICAGLGYSRLADHARTFARRLLVRDTLYLRTRWRQFITDVSGLHC